MPSDKLHRKGQKKMLETIQEILRDYKDDPTIELEPETNLNTDLGLSSIDYFSLIMEIEDAFGVKIPDNKFTAFRTVGDVMEYIEGKQ